ncbi:MAG: hypothetical protein WCG91_02345 [Candidatus Shapirobacteria bacterium]
MKKLDFKLPESIFGFEIGLVKILLLPLPLIFFFIVSLNLVIIPKIGEIGSTTKEITKIKAQTKVVVEKKVYLMSRDQEKLKTDEAYLQSAILKENQSYFLVEVVRSVASKYGFQIKSFSISPGKLKDDDKVKIANKDVMNRLPISVVLVGPKEKHLDLLLAMEKSLPILVIDKFSINTSGEMAELNLDVNSFYLNNKVASDVVNLSLSDLTLNKDEADLLDRLGDFEKVELGSAVKSGESGQFIKYQKENPFSL